MTDHLDDMPNRTAEHVGEEDSRRRFGDLFKDPHFLIREDIRNDYGVDLAVEALSDSGSPTNFRAHAQLKASTKDANSDDSFSYPVARTNLNYLLNHPGSFYVFYARDEDQLYFKTAEAVFQEREAEGPEWRAQASLTIRFSEILDEQAVRQLRQDIVTLNRYLRAFRLGLAAQSVPLDNKVTFDPATGTVRDLGAVIELLCDRGLAWVRSGKLAGVDGMLKQVSEADRTGDVWLVSAYANYSRGLVYDAANDADRAATLGLSSEDKCALASYVSATARFAQGHIDVEELERRLVGIERDYPTSVSALYSKLDRLQREGVRGGAQTVAEIDSLATDIRGRGDAFEAMSMQADTLHLQARYFAIQRRYMMLVGDYTIHRAVGVEQRMMPARAVAAQKLVQSLREVYQGFESIFERAKVFGDRRILAEALYAFELCKLQDRMQFEKTAPKDPRLDSQEAALTQASIERLGLAARLFEEANSPEQALRCRMLEVDVLWVAGRQDDARNQAVDIATIASRLGLGALASRAIEVVAGKSPLAAWDEIPPLDH